MEITQLGLAHQPFEHIYLVPVGGEVHATPSQLSSRSLLHQLERYMEEALATLSPEEQHKIATLTKLPLGKWPVAVVSEQMAYAHLIRPDYFLWKQQAPTLQLAEGSRYFDGRNLYVLSDAQLQAHCQDAIRDYLFVADYVHIQKKEWKTRARAAYQRHPFIQFAAEKRPIIEAIETLNRSMLLGVLTPPEDVAFWRRRVEIVLRPYRALPTEWRYQQDDEPLTLQTVPSTRKWLVTGTKSGYSFYYVPDDDRVELVEEINMPQAIKRIATLERQFNELAQGTPKIMEALTALQAIQRQFIDELPSTGSGDFLDLLATLRDATFPEETVQPKALSLQHVALETIDSLKFVKPYIGMSEEQWQEAFQKDKSAQSEHPADETPAVYFSSKGFYLYEEQVDEIEEFLAREEQITFHLLIQVLKGEATSKVRTLKLHQSPIFGLLRPWPKKLIPQAIKSFW